MLRYEPEHSPLRSCAPTSAGHFFPLCEAGKPEKVFANQFSFAYVEQGSGPPIILVHGSVSDYREWSNEIPPFAQHYRVIAYSRRYHWPNVAPDNGADARLERQTDDLAAIIEALNIAPAHIVGHSFGGAIALNVALKHPKLVRTLVLAEPALSTILGSAPEDLAVSKESQAIRGEMKEVFASGDAERIIPTYASHVAPGQLEKATSEMRKMVVANAPAFRLDFNSRRTTITCENSGQLSLPVLIISGNQSPRGLQRIAEVSAHCIKGAKLIKIPQATHWMQHDHPKEFNEAVLKFLAAHRN